MLSAARERFARYTRHAFALEMADAGLIQARDQTQKELRHLDQLSAGTRMQLLLAVRLAYTSVLERGAEALPIFLDEALTTTDPERFEIIARSLKDTADDEGRQIFYLSSEPADVIRWERAIGARPHHIDLPGVRFGEPGRAPADYVVPEREPLPAPDGLSAEDYAARLWVPLVNPRNGAAAIPVFYLLRDNLALLYRLMNDWRIDRIGPLEQLLASDAADRAVPDTHARERLQGCCEAARVWVALWRQGRGNLVDRSALEASGAISGHFIDQVSELVQSLDGDAEAVIAALAAGEIARFRQMKADELVAWLEEHGYLDRAEPLSTEARERQTLQQVARDVEHDRIQTVVRALESATRRP